MVEKYHEFKSSLKVIEAWKQQFPNIKSPKAKNVLLQVKKFKTYGSIAELQRTQSKINAKKRRCQKPANRLS